jgi:hypothetical protein
MSVSIRSAIRGPLATTENGLSTSEGPERKVRNLRRRRSLGLLASLAASTLLGATMTAPANAAVTAGAVDPSNHFPVSYTGTSGGVSAPLQLCLEQTVNCLAIAPDPEAPVVFPDNFPNESFWFSARAKAGIVRDYRAELEATFAGSGAVVDGQQIGFARLRFKITSLKKNASYRVQHPYGDTVLQATAADPDHPKDTRYGSINVTTDAGICAPTATVPCDWAAVGNAFLGDYQVGTTSWLKQANAPAGTLGSPLLNRSVSGAPSGFNFVEVTGPGVLAGSAAIDAKVTTFAVQGLLAP